MNYYLRAFKNYFNFKGRACRAEYWWFTLANSGLMFLIFLFLLFCIIGDSAQDPNQNLHHSNQARIVIGIIAIILLTFYAITFIPCLSLLIRRLHDTNRSGWYSLIAFIPSGYFFLIPMLIQDGTKGPNKYGEDPNGDKLNLDDFGKPEVELKN
jgi:uncharacterized membrane protein YhaH (DUF805 family)